MPAYTFDPTDPSNLTIPTALGNVTAEVVVDGFTKGINWQSGPRRQVVYRTRWHESDAFCDAMMGLTSSATRGAPGFRAWVVALAQPYPKNPRLVCRDVQAAGEGRPNRDDVDGKLVKFDFCLVTATYEVPAFDLNGLDNNLVPPGVSQAQYVTARRTTDIQEEHMPSSTAKAAAANKLTWKSSGDPVDDSQPFVMPITRIELTYHMLPYMPGPQFDAFVGQVNGAAGGAGASANFFLGYDNGCVRVDGVGTSSEPQILPDGTRGFDVTVIYAIRSRDWNLAINPNTGAWDYPWISSTGTYKYQYNNLNPLLTF